MSDDDKVMKYWKMQIAYAERLTKQGRKPPPSTIARRKRKRSGEAKSKPI